MLRAVSHLHQAVHFEGGSEESSGPSPHAGSRRWLVQTTIPYRARCRLVGSFKAEFFIQSVLTFDLERPLTFAFKTTEQFWVWRFMAAIGDEIDADLSP